MKRLSFLLITGSMFLSACASMTPSAPHGGNHVSVSTDNRTLTILDQSTDSEIAFSVREGNETFSDYGISHTKEMHLIVVRDDLQNFRHLHPERDSDGIWRVAFTPPAGGTYWRYADFVDSKQNPSTIRFDKQYSGTLGTYGIAKNFERVKIVDDYRIELKDSVSNGDVTFAYAITDSQGQPQQLEEYLGAIGHSVLISPSGDFIHTHPPETGTMPVFTTAVPPDPFYRAFTQFKIKGEVKTVHFDWQP
jgi:hypothetical protein